MIINGDNIGALFVPLFIYILQLNMAPMNMLHMYCSTQYYRAGDDQI